MTIHEEYVLGIAKRINRSRMKDYFKNIPETGIDAAYILADLLASELVQYQGWSLENNAFNCMDDYLTVRGIIEDTTPIEPAQYFISYMENGINCFQPIYILFANVNEAIDIWRKMYPELMPCTITGVFRLKSYK